MLFSQVEPVPVPVETGQPVPVLSASQLDGLVAPIALYPDPLISQILVAATYPLEAVEAYQWLQRNAGLTGPALTQAAGAQNWDPSIQALVMFPDVLQRLNEDVAWTASLGNAFLNQQADVMSAIQRMRLSAEQSRTLVSTPQQQVITTAAAGPPVVEIVPANPEVIYVPVYDPVAVWGPPVYYPYARWYYPPVRSGLFFSVGVPIGGFFGTGWTGWGGWGWHPVWVNRTVVVNNTFVRRINFNASRVPNGAGVSVWSHDPFHRREIPNPTQALNQRFRGNVQHSVAPQRPPIPMQPPVRGFVPSSRPAPAPMPIAPPPRETLRRVPRERMADPPLVQNPPNRMPMSPVDRGNPLRRPADRPSPGFTQARPAPPPMARPMMESPHREAPPSRQREDRRRPSRP